MLIDCVVQMVDLPAELEVVRSLPSALEPRQSHVSLFCFAGVLTAEVLAIGIIKEYVGLLQRRRQRSARCVRRAYAIRLPNGQRARRRQAEVMVILEVIPKAARQN